ncbi:MAG: Rnf-Nqr domain containing protein [Candidatus Thermoplasmatota archaeon]|nr:Rnf-Nqr domain containing protein [Candidatus Thermoplasmatota archaeon]
MAGDLLSLAIGAVLVNNFIFARFLGLCPFFGTSNSWSNSMGMGLMVIFVMTCSSVLSWIVDAYVLIPLNATYMETLVFIIIIAVFVQLVELIIRKYSPALYKSLGIFLPLMVVNCAILGVTLINARAGYSFSQALVNGFFSGVGFWFAMILMAAIRERLELLNIPESVRGVPIAIVVAAGFSMAFRAFSGLV